MSQSSNGINGTSGDLHIDLMIDNAVAARAAEAAALRAVRQANSRLSPDEALIRELSQLDAVDWPADEVGDRIAAAVATASAGAAPIGWRHRPEGRHRRSTRTRWLVAGTSAAAAAALITAGLQLLGGQHHVGKPGAEPATTGHSSTGQSSRATKTSPVRPAALTAMVVVSHTDALQAIGLVSNGSSFLTCVTRSICYIEAQPFGGNHVDIARSLDGGATWTAGAPLPPLTFEWNAGITCPRPELCFAPFGPLGLLATTDGFAHVQIRPLTMPAGVSGQVSWLSCPTTRSCVAAVIDGTASQTLIYSDDGGTSWAAASAPAFGADGQVVQLRCDHDGACIAAIVGGTANHPIVAALGSTDGGRSWTISPSRSLPEMEQWLVSCGDGRNCLVGSNAGFLAFMHVAVGGRVNVRTQAFAKNWPALAIALSCPTGRDCFVETGDSTGNGYEHVTIEATRDNGRTWTSLGTPMAPALPHDIAAFLSCPVPAGCIAIGNDPSQAQQNWVVLSNLRENRRG